MLTQSNSILRYVGKLAGLYPSDPVLAAFVDEVLDACEESTIALGPSMWECDEKKVLEMRRVFVADNGPLHQWLKGIERILMRNGNTGFCAGSDLSVADLKLVQQFQMLFSGELTGRAK